MIDRSPEERKRRALRLSRLLYAAVTVSFVLPIVFLVFRLTREAPGTGTVGLHSEADYVLMLVECLLGLVVINLPTLLARKFRFEVPLFLYILYILFLYCAIFLGEVRSFYYLIPHWDVVLHAFSSMMTGFFGVMAVTILNRDEHLVMNLSPFFISLFAFSFAVTIGTVWEIYEFSCDGLLGLNMQKFTTADGTVLVGRAALSDTMKDLIVDTLGALLSSAIGFLSLRFNKKWFVPVLTDEAETEADRKET